VVSLVQTTRDGSARAIKTTISQEIWNTLLLPNDEGIISANSY
jgi:hypothetical protein